MSKDAELIKLSRFAERIEVCTTRAREMSRSKVFCERKISVNINPDGKQGGIRINWKKYLEFLSENDVVPGYKRVKPKLSAVK